MAFQVRLQCKTVLANVTFKEVIFFVHTNYVLIQGVLGGKLITTNFTDSTIGLMASVLQMLLMQLLMGKFNTAFSAGVCCKEN